MTKKSNWDSEAMRDSLISDMKEEVRNGGAGNLNEGNAVTAPAEQPAGSKAQEPTKGVQTYVPMSMYRRLNDLKLSRGETIGSLVIQAIGFWLDVQEGKTK